MVRPRCPQITQDSPKIAQKDFRKRGERYSLTHHSFLGVLGLFWVFKKITDFCGQIRRSIYNLGGTKYYYFRPTRDIEGQFCPRTNCGACLSATVLKYSNANVWRVSQHTVSIDAARHA